MEEEYILLYMYIKMESDGTIFALVFVDICSLIFHTWSLTVICRYKDIRKKRFLGLVLNLSISDAALSIEVIVFGILINCGIHQCVFYHIVTATFIFPLFQTFQICSYQLNATFVKKKRLFCILSISVAVFVLLQLLATILYFVFIDFPLNVLDPECGMSLIFYCCYDIPIVVLLVLISFCTSVNIIRIKGKSRDDSGQMTEFQKQKSRERRSREKRNMVTFIMIIFVTLLVYLPVEIFAFLYQIGVFWSIVFEQSLYFLILY